MYVLALYLAKVDYVFCRTHVNAELRRLLPNSVTVVWFVCGGEQEG